MIGSSFSFSFADDEDTQSTNDEFQQVISDNLDADPEDDDSLIAEIRVEDLTFVEYTHGYKSDGYFYYDLDNYIWYYQMLDKVTVIMKDGNEYHGTALSEYGTICCRISGQTRYETS